jgi:cysteine-rich repeat protein
MNPSTLARFACHALLFVGAGAVACFSGEDLVGQPCQSDADCNVVAGVTGRDIACTNNICGAVCGDGVVTKPFEQCEDGNDDNSDNCVNCQQATCGDQATRAGIEECDDGNLIDTDACARCKNATCGDKFVWAGRETCDDGNDDRTDGCVDCQLVSCGDGLRSPETEACDDGDDDDNDGCNTACEAVAERLSHGWDASHTCAIRDGALRCWGSNAYGQLGYGHASSVGNEPSDLPPSDVPLGAPALDVVVGRSYTCVLLDVPGNNVHCWGDVSTHLGMPTIFANDNITRGDEPGELPVPAVQLGGPVTQLALNYLESCALFADGALRCWDVVMADDSTPSLSFFLPVLPGPVVQVVRAGEDEVCMLLESGEVWCSAIAPYKVIGNRRISQITSGESHTCVRFVDGDVYCWGANQYGQLGNPDFEIAVPLGEAAVDVAAGSTHTCAVLVSGGVKCWGSNLAGQLGHPVKEIRDPRMFGPIPLGGPARAVTVAIDRTCAQLRSGAVTCWGFNSDGALGVGHTDNIGDDPLEMPPEPALLYANP